MYNIYIYIYITVLSYPLKCRKNPESKNPKVAKTKNRRIMFTSNNEVSGSKKSRFIKEQEAKGLLSMIGKFDYLAHY